MNLEPGPQIDLRGAFRRRAGVLFGVAGAVLLASYWIAMAIPNEYESYATLLIEPQMVSDTLVESGARESDINNRLHLMSAQILSRARLSRVIDEIGLYEEESEIMTREEVINLMRADIQIVPILPEMDPAMEKNRGDIQITTFQIWFTYEKAQLAAKVAQRLANDFIDEHIAERIDTTRTSLEFIETEQLRLRDLMDSLEKQIAEIKDQNAGRLPEDLMANQRQLERTITELIGARHDLDIARSDEEYWKHQRISETGPQPDYTSLTRKMQSLELLLAEMRSRGYTEKHPDYLQVQQEFRELARNIELISEETLDNIHPAASKPRPEEKRATVQAKSTQEEVQRLSARLVEVQNRIEDTPRVAERLNALQREYAQTFESLRDFTQRRQQAEVQAALERRQLGEKFRILEPSFPAPDPSAPNRPLIMIVGLFLGFALGGAVAVAVESTDSSMHGARELQSALGIPVLASIPRIILEADRRARNRRRLRAALAASAVTFVCMLGGAATYVYVNGAPKWLTQDDEVKETPTTPPAAEGAGLELVDFHRMV